MRSAAVQVQVRIQILVLVLAGALLPAQAADRPSSTVGVPERVRQIVLPGSELVAAPIDVKSKIVLRILAVWPHGDAFRYDLEYEGLEPGDFDLKDFLARKDGSLASGLPPIPVTVHSVLPPGQVVPRALDAGRTPGVGGYRTVLVVGAILWVAGFLAIVISGRRGRRAGTARPGAPTTLADRLRPLVDAAVSGNLSREERAHLELGLVALWRRRLGLEERRPEDVLPLLRAHPEAGPLVSGLEEWLHRPGAARDVDVAALLAPYKDLPPDALDAVAARAS